MGYIGLISQLIVDNPGILLSLLAIHLQLEGNWNAKKEHKKLEKNLSQLKLKNQQILKLLKL